MLQQWHTAIQAGLRDKGQKMICHWHNCIPRSCVSVAPAFHRLLFTLHSSPDGKVILKTQKFIVATHRGNGSWGVDVGDGGAKEEGGARSIGMESARDLSNTQRWGFLSTSQKVMQTHCNCNPLGDLQQPGSSATREFAFTRFYFLSRQTGANTALISLTRFLTAVTLDSKLLQRNLARRPHSVTMQKEEAARCLHCTIHHSSFFCCFIATNKGQHNCSILTRSEYMPFHEPLCIAPRLQTNMHVALCIRWHERITKRKQVRPNELNFQACRSTKSILWIFNNCAEIYSLIIKTILSRTVCIMQNLMGLMRKRRENFHFHSVASIGTLVLPATQLKSISKSLQCDLSLKKINTFTCIFIDAIY